MVEFSRDIQRKMVSKKDAIGLLFLNFYFIFMLELIVPDISHKVEWEKIMKEWDDSRKRPRIFFQDSYEQFMEKISRISYSDDIENQVPRSSIFFLLDTESNKII